MDQNQIQAAYEADTASRRRVRLGQLKQGAKLMAKDAAKQAAKKVAKKAAKRVWVWIGGIMLGLLTNPITWVVLLALIIVLVVNYCSENSLECGKLILDGVLKNLSDYIGNFLHGSKV